MTRNVRIGLLLVVCLAGYLAFTLRMGGFNRAGRVRNTMIASTRTSCRQTATARAAITKATPSQVDSFCDCLTDKTVSMMSDSEVLAAADRGSNPNAADIAMIKSGAQLCNLQVFGSPR